MIHVDINVLEDSTRKRRGGKGSEILLQEIEAGRIDGGVSAWTVAVVYYFFVKRGLNDSQARQRTKLLIQDGKIQILPLTPDIIRAAFADTRIPDFEDALQFHTAKANNAEAIITRNLKDFALVQFEIPVMTPEDFLRQWAARQRGQP
ncbi:MAG: PIN domain-containing protein [Chloroflexi bacterium]|nr:PIN domain-containing protein [Chloroflexota bacterium]